MFEFGFGQQVGSHHAAFRTAVRQTHERAFQLITSQAPRPRRWSRVDETDASLRGPVEGWLNAIASNGELPSLRFDRQCHRRQRRGYLVRSRMSSARLIASAPVELPTRMRKTSDRKAVKQWLLTWGQTGWVGRRSVEWCAVVRANAGFSNWLSGNDRS